MRVGNNFIVVIVLSVIVLTSFFGIILFTKSGSLFITPYFSMANDRERIAWTEPANLMQSSSNIYIYDYISDEMILSIELDMPTDNKRPAWSPDNSMIAVICHKVDLQYLIIEIFDIETAELIYSHSINYKENQPYTTVQWTDDGNYLYITYDYGSQYHIIDIIDTELWEVWSWSVEGNNNFRSYISTNGNMVFFSTYDQDTDACVTEIYDIGLSEFTSTIYDWGEWSNSTTLLTKGGIINSNGTRTDTYRYYNFITETYVYNVTHNYPDGGGYWGGVNFEGDKMVYELDGTAYIRSIITGDIISTFDLRDSEMRFSHIFWGRYNNLIGYTLTAADMKTGKYMVIDPDTGELIASVDRDRPSLI